MKIKIDSIKDAGFIEKERVIFKVLEPTNIGQYLVAQSTKVTEGTFSSDIKNIKWFPDQEMKEGDLVVLYTKKGQKGNAINSDNSTTYFYYWGLDHPHSEINNAVIVIFETAWSSLVVPTK